MSEFFSNVSISLPIDLANIKADLDFNGIMWSHQYGFMFQGGEDTIPGRGPAN